MKLSKSVLRTLIKEELKNLKVNEISDLIEEENNSLLRQAADFVTGGDAKKSEEFSEKSISPYVKRLTDEVIKLKRQVREIQEQMKNMNLGR